MFTRSCCESMAITSPSSTSRSASVNGASAAAPTVNSIDTASTAARHSVLARSAGIVRFLFDGRGIAAHRAVHRQSDPNGAAAALEQGAVLAHGDQREAIDVLADPDDASADVDSRGIACGQDRAQ